MGGKVRSLWTHYYDSLDALIFVVDSCDKEKLYIVREEMVKLNKDLEFQNVLTINFIDKVVFLVLFNKCDLPNSLDL